jgi:hypothetical protein
MLSAERDIKPHAIVVAALVYTAGQSMARYAQQKLPDQSPTLLWQARDFVSVSRG